MATIRLIPSVLYNAAGTSYLSVSNESNAFTNCDSDTYATISNIQSSTSNRYVYLRGFNFDDIPSGAIINSFTVKLKAKESGTSTSTSYRPILCSGTSVYSNDYANTYIGATEATLTFTATQDLETFINAGSNFGIRINCRRASRNTAGYVYIYGAEIEVDYTLPVSATVTSTLSGDGTISPSGATSTYEGAEYTLTITPDDLSDTVTITNNGTDVTADLVAHGSETTETATPSSATTSGISSGSSYMQYAVGYSAESPYSTSTSDNAYASSSSTGYAEYSFDFSNIPATATIESIEVRCYGHRESSTTDSTHVSKCGIYNNGTLVSSEVEFSSTTANNIVTLTPTSSISRSDLDNLTVRHTVGYYGGLVLGISFEVTYSTGSGVQYYTYTYTVTGDATIAVTIGGGSGETDKLYVVVNGTATEVTQAWHGVNGSAVEYTDLTAIFDTTKKYVKA